MKLYTSDGCAYDGMDADTVTRLRTELGQSTTFVYEAAYQSTIAAQQVKP